MACVEMSRSRRARCLAATAASFVAGLAALTAPIAAAAQTAPEAATPEPQAPAPAPAPAAQPPADPMSTGTGSGVMRSMFGGGLSREAVASVAGAAAIHPLGTLENPVRATMPEGQRAYIARLRCPRGGAPRILSRANGGHGIYGAIVDVYYVQCRGEAEARAIAIDMYHDWVENAPAAGFTIVPAR